MSGERGVVLRTKDFYPPCSSRIPLPHMGTLFPLYVAMPDKGGIFINYQQAMDYLERAHLYGSKLGLEGISGLLEELGNPQKMLKFVHVAGTNGKGSVSAYLAGILHAGGARTGLFVSPYVVSFGERIQVDGMEITETEFADAMTEVAGADKRAQFKTSREATVFELICAAGFLHFLKKGCDIVVLEVGLGGRLDATNVIGAPEAAVIASIGYDHMEQLGYSLPEIAAEKGGIIKKGCDVVLSGQDGVVEATIENICNGKNSRLYIADATKAALQAMSLKGLVFDYGGYKGLETSLTGLHQLKNAVTAVKTAELLYEKGYNTGEEQIREGLKKAYMPGRMETLSEKPVFIVDGAHNPNGVHCLMESLDALFPSKKITFITGVLADKDYFAGIKDAIARAKRFYTATPPSGRALSAQELYNVIKKETDVPVTACGTPAAAVRTALDEAGENDIICAFGSLYQVGEIRACFGLGKPDGGELQ